MNNKMTITIKNGQLLDPANNINQAADIQISDGKISAIEAANSISKNDNQVIDASGLTIIPGLVDCCARLREPGLENKATIRSEAVAATKAGITTNKIFMAAKPRVPEKMMLR